jgi:hypothetical protein
VIRGKFEIAFKACSETQKQQCFERAKKVIDPMRGTNLKLERWFDCLYRKTPP